MTTAETTVRALAAARYSWAEVWHHAAPNGRHYVLAGATRHAHVTIGGGGGGCATPEAARAGPSRAVRSRARPPAGSRAHGAHARLPPIARSATRFSHSR